MIRYAIYTRQSVEKLADFSSCDAQFHTCQDFVKALNDPLVQWCGQHSNDPGHSGSTRDRTGRVVAALEVTGRPPPLG